MTNPDLVKLADELDSFAHDMREDANDATALWLEQRIAILRRLASSDGGVKVRELEWRPADDELGRAGMRFKAEPSFGGVYYVNKTWHGQLGEVWSSLNNEFHRTLDAAKAAAQADYEARIKSALVEAPAVKGEPEPVAWPANLNPRTLDLVQRFALALAKKLRLAEEKYGHTDGWLRDDWESECRDHLYQHLEKGDPRDVAAYCAFMWHHDWITCRPVITAPPADAGMREALEDAEGIFEQVRLILINHLDEPVRSAFWKAIEGREKCKAALTAPGATTKSDGGGEVITAEQMDAIETAAIAGQPLSNYSDYTPVTVRGSTSDPSSTRSEVSVEELAAFLDPRAFDEDQFERHKYCSPLSIEVVQDRARDKARALLDQFEIRRK